MLLLLKTKKTKHIWLRLPFTDCVFSIDICCIFVFLVWVSEWIMKMTSMVVNSLNVYDCKQWALYISTKHFAVSYDIYLAMTLHI